jgi:hypothetical protein
MRSAWSGSPDPAALETLIRRIVEVARPDRIVLFGSTARGEMGPDSDIDVLVVKSDVEHRRRLASTPSTGSLPTGAGQGTWARRSGAIGWRASPGPSHSSASAWP